MMDANVSKLQGLLAKRNRSVSIIFRGVASPILHLTKGDMRRLICPGHSDYRDEDHTDWEKVELVPNPDS